MVLVIWSTTPFDVKYGKDSSMNQALLAILTDPNVRQSSAVEALMSRLVVAGGPWGN